jgi:7,8-dihydropterin-6-yl-methyl-4-(beta-D-ribofuranosyl)aminobenzene 5'-phosphate synthase
MEKNEELNNLITIFGDPYSLLTNYIKGKNKCDSIFLLEESIIEKIPDLGATDKLEIIPVVEWFTSSDEFLSIDGVSYLIRTDSSTILFDLGSYNEGYSAEAQFNLIDSENMPAPLMHNLKSLGISLSEIDAIVISHSHYDHTGSSGVDINTKTFYLYKEQFNIGDIKVYTPVKMSYPGNEPIYSKKPIKISHAIATTGVISNYDFFIGEMQEQALAINVKDLGIVVVTGCGHQTIDKIHERIMTLFNEPLYGLIGGLHLVCSNTRNLGRLKYVGSGRPPWDPMSIEHIQEYIDLLKHNQIEIIGLSGHDSCDSTINEFRKAFGKNYKDIKVGEPIVLYYER